MADPHIQSPMDFWDYLTVVLYRCGFCLAAVAVAATALQTTHADLLLLLSGTLLASSLHLYLKSFRLLFQFVAWIGLFCQIVGLPLLASGAMLLVIGGLAYKEYFCFRIVGLQFMPLFVALFWLGLAFDIVALIWLSAGIITPLLTLLSVQKWRMPLHFDIGDKTKYQM